MTGTRKILILGAGEIGLAIAEALYNHTLYRSDDISLVLAVRPQTVNLLNSEQTNDRVQSLVSLRFRTKRAINFIGVDLVADDETALSRVFQSYSCVIHAGGMTSPEGTQMKITKAALAAGVAEYIPWQWGIDYDIIGKNGAMGLFREQAEIREVLRGQTRTKWFILSCGVFMSFLFEEFWGVVVRDDEGKISGVNALGGWDHHITVTTAEDIARCNAELVLKDTDKRGKPVFIAGDTIRYDEFADIVDKVADREVKREVWTTEYLKNEAEKDPENKLLKYRLVFSVDEGATWAKEGTYDVEKGIETEGVAQYMRRMQMK